MGWTIPYDMPHRKDLIRERVAERVWIKPDGTTTVSKVALKHCYRGGMRSGVLYTVWEVTTSPEGAEPATHRFIEIDLLKYYRGAEFTGGGSWGYKDMDCCCGPCETSCPISYLDLCPPHPGGSEWCANWHTKVRERYAAKREKRVLKVVRST